MIDTSILFRQSNPDFLDSASRGLQLGQGLRQMLALRQAGKMSQIEADNEADTYAQRKAFANNSMFGRELNAALKADQAAKAQALMAQQKHEADTAKTWSDATKNNADAGKIGVETQGLGLKNSGTLLANANRALTVAAQTGDPMAAKLALNNAYKAGAVSPEIYEQYSKQIDILGTDPEALKQFAQNITLASAEKPDQYLFTTADNELDNQTAVDNNIRTNQTSENNNIRTTQASMYSTDVNAETADKNRQQSQQQFIATQEYNQQKLRMEQNKGQVVTGADGKSYIYYPNIGKYEPMLNPEGQHIGKLTKSGEDLRKESERLQKMESILTQAEGLIEKSTSSGLGNLVDGAYGFVGKSNEGADNLAALKSLQGALVMMMPRMEGPQSDKDVQLYREMAGRLGEPIPVSQRIEAIKVIRDLNAKYADIQGVSQNNQQPQKQSHKGSTMTLNAVKEVAQKLGISTEQAADQLIRQGITIE